MTPKLFFIRVIILVVKTINIINLMTCIIDMLFILIINYAFRTLQCLLFCCSILHYILSLLLNFINSVVIRFWTDHVIADIRNEFLIFLAQVNLLHVSDSRYSCIMCAPLLHCLYFHALLREGLLQKIGFVMHNKRKVCLCNITS